MRWPWILSGFLAASCGPAHIGEYSPKRREYELPPASNEPPKREAGSLWMSGGQVERLFTDNRALRENDLLVIQVEEIANAQRSANTDLQRNTELQAQLTAFLQRANATPVDLNGNASASSGSRFDSRGSTARTERLTATVPAMVRKVLPNGNLFVEGHRVVLVNSEEQHFYISGVVRPADIDDQNSVKSTMVADAEIEFTGRGVLTDNQRQGWFQRWFGWLWPF